MLLAIPEGPSANIVRRTAHTWSLCYLDTLTAVLQVPCREGCCGLLDWARCRECRESFNKSIIPAYCLCSGLQTVRDGLADMYSRGRRCPTHDLRLSVGRPLLSFPMLSRLSIQGQRGAPSTPRRPGENKFCSTVGRITFERAHKHQVVAGS